MVIAYQPRRHPHGSRFRLHFSSDIDKLPGSLPCVDKRGQGYPSNCPCSCNAQVIPGARPRIFFGGRHLRKLCHREAPRCNQGVLNVLRQLILIPERPQVIGRDQSHIFSRTDLPLREGLGRNHFPLPERLGGNHCSLGGGRKQHGRTIEKGRRRRKIIQATKEVTPPLKTAPLTMWGFNNPGRVPTN